MTTSLVTYLRVSTQRQGESGLGLEAQRQAAASYAQIHGGTIIKEFVEVESGRKCNRPVLAQALAFAKRKRCRLVFAKVDRLARNARFLLTILESGADVVFADLPSIPAGPTGKFILTQMASVAELEAGLISQRTKDALRAAKARGQLLGSARPDHWLGREQVRLDALAKARASSVKTRRQNATTAYADLMPTIRQLRTEGKSLSEIAAVLNADGHTSGRGLPFSGMQVHRVLKRQEVAHA
ncbi:hypothetical protein AYO44_16550 [Planctomycetaceae bacterium SCGC AG-212-F19]|nr:hypothetical protein AYO44_16550 [Planctomycetaceae bacterium SCGC AG-212-F19]